MAYASKILPLIVLPVGITLMLLAAGLITRKRRFFALGAAVLLVFSLPVTGDALATLVERGYARQPAASAPTADAIVVLSTGRVQVPGVPPVSEWSDPDRYFAGVELLRAEKAPLLVFTGGSSPWEMASPLEGDILRQVAIDSGIPADRIVTTGRVFNTADEAVAVADLLRGRLPNPARVILVTSAFHMPRASKVFIDAGLQVTPFAVDFSGGGSLGVMAFIPTASALERSQRSLREIYGRMYYGVMPL